MWVAWWTAPDSQAYHAIGLQGQYISVDPATPTVIVKCSYFPRGDPSAAEETAAVFAAAAAWQPEGSSGAMEPQP